MPFLRALDLDFTVQPVGNLHRRFHALLLPELRSCINPDNLSSPRSLRLFLPLGLGGAGPVADEMAGEFFVAGEMGIGFEHRLVPAVPGEVQMVVGMGKAPGQMLFGEALRGQKTIRQLRQFPTIVLETTWTTRDNSCKVPGGQLRLSEGDKWVEG